ncbi:MAG: CPBP family intramembrane glutamic endopeptidase [Chthoniobacteraceae bacterium]
MKEFGKILIYFIGVIVLGALLAPPLFWLGQSVARTGVLTFLGETEFQKFFNRAVLIAAIALLWPVTRWLRLGHWRALGLDPDARWKQHLAAGFAAAALVVALMAAAYISQDIYHWKRSDPPWDSLPKLLLSAVVVGLLEEGLFRGGLLGMFRRSMSPGAALMSVTSIFAAVHFLQPDEGFAVDHVTWMSGFALAPHLFHQFAEPMTILSSLTTIFVLGLVCGAVTLRTRSLWAAIGFHAGVVFVKMSFSKFTKRDAAYLPWVGEKLEIGLVPVAMLLLGGALLWLWLRYVDRPLPAPRN